jgi:hypothetical protein
MWFGMGLEMVLELGRDGWGKRPVSLLLAMVPEIFDKCSALHTNKEPIALVEEVSIRI